MSRRGASVFEILRTALPRSRRSRIFSLELIRLRWAAIVGTALAERSEPSSVGVGRLTVRVTDPAWGREIVKHEREIVSRLAAVVGARAVRSVQFVRVRGPLWESEPPWTVSSLRHPPPELKSGEPSEMIVEAAKAIEDPGLRFAVTRTASRYLAVQETRRRRLLTPPPTPPPGQGC